MPSHSLSLGSLVLARQGQRRRVVVQPLEVELELAVRIQGQARQQCCPSGIAEPIQRLANTVVIPISAEVLSAAITRPVTMRIDADVVAWFRGFGSGYQTRINSVLRAHMEAKRDRG